MKGQKARWQDSTPDSTSENFFTLIEKKMGKQDSLHSPEEPTNEYNRVSLI